MQLGMGRQLPQGYFFRKLYSHCIDFRLSETSSRLQPHQPKPRSLYDRHVDDLKVTLQAAMVGHCETTFYGSASILQPFSATSIKLDNPALRIIRPRGGHST